MNTYFFEAAKKVWRPAANSSFRRTGASRSSDKDRRRVKVFRALSDRNGSSRLFPIDIQADLYRKLRRSL